MKLNRSNGGFTLVELVIIIVVLGILATVAIPKIGGIIGSSRETATKAEMAELKMAIIGDARVVAGGKMVNRGFLGDVGHPPGQLIDLVVKPDSLSPYNHVLGFGWNGPYIDTGDGSSFRDAWDVAYAYDAGARTLESTGSGASITLGF
jgi:prepilin-type N-terminal cleavage/methylation domain-containing protein